MLRRNFSKVMAATAAFGTLPRIGSAQEHFPDRQVRLVVGFPAGQSSDVGARIVAARLSEDLGQSVFVDNKPGASGIIAHEFVKKSAPDGYTLLLTSTAPLAINPFLFRNIPYNSAKDFTPIVLINTSPMYLVTAADSPFTSLRELVAFSKANPGKVSYGSSGSGTTGHIAMEMLKSKTGLDATHIPYKGSGALITDLIGGRVQAGFDAASSIAPLLSAGKVKALGTSGPKRSSRFPKVLTIAEQGVPNFQALTWAGLVGPAGMPSAVVEQLNVAVNRVLNNAQVQQHFANVGSTVNGGTSESFNQFVREELKLWGPAVKASGAQLD